jgi:hypothetical protein
MDKAASENLERLVPFVGLWNTTGELKNPAPGQSAKFKATDKYEWMPGGQFLLHHFEADMPDGKVQGIEVIGYDSEKDSYPMHSFDSTGTTNLMQGTVEKDTWTFNGETLRFTGGFRENGNVFGGLWESRSSGDASWNPLMEITLRKAK